MYKWYYYISFALFMVKWQTLYCIIKCMTSYVKLLRQVNWWNLLIILVLLSGFLSFTTIVANSALLFLYVLFHEWEKVFMLKKRIHTTIVCIRPTTTETKICTSEGWTKWNSIDWSIKNETNSPTYVDL